MQSQLSIHLCSMEKSLFSGNIHYIKLHISTFLHCLDILLGHHCFKLNLVFFRHLFNTTRYIMKPPKEDQKDPTEWTYICGKCTQTFSSDQDREIHKLMCQQPSQSEAQLPKFECPENYKFPTGSDTDQRQH